MSPLLTLMPYHKKMKKNFNSNSAVQRDHRLSLLLITPYIVTRIVILKYSQDGHYPYIVKPNPGFCIYLVFFSRDSLWSYRSYRKWCIWSYNIFSRFLVIVPTFFKRNFSPSIFSFTAQLVVYFIRSAIFMEFGCWLSLEMYAILKEGVF